jgi:hypothetical protein
MLNAKQLFDQYYFSGTDDLGVAPSGVVVRRSEP